MLQYNRMGNFVYSVSFGAVIYSVMFPSFWHGSAILVISVIFSTCIKNVCTISPVIWPQILQDEADFYVHKNMWCYKVRFVLCVCLKCVCASLLEFETVEKCTSMLSWLYGCFILHLLLQLWIFDKISVFLLGC